jgi:hypothetical protein
MYSEIVRLRADVCTGQRKGSEVLRIANKEKLKLKAVEQRIKELEAAVKRRQAGGGKGRIKTKERALPWA